MPSGLLLGGALRGHTPKTSASYYVKAEEISDKEISVNETGVTLRERKRSSDSKGSDVQGEVKQSDWYANKRNATYLNEEEYDDDLAQLDVLLHYVNNLSASLEFLRWEDKRISTDLVPTLLNMYDALYARLSENPRSNSQEDLSTGALEIRKFEKDDRQDVQRENHTKENAYNDELFIREEESSFSKNKKDAKGLEGKCEKCGDCEVQKRLCTCTLTSQSDNSSYRTFHNNLDTRLSIEHDYDIPESFEKPPEKGFPSDINKTSLNGFVHKPGLKLTLNIEKTIKNRQLVGREGSPLARRGRDLLYRPLSSISSTSSSSSSSNSLPRVRGGTLPSYLASAESLNNENETHPLDLETSSRRRDRGLKARREKALRAGSDDSGVQCHSISLPAPPTLRPRYCDPNLNYLDRVVLEIVETEEIYVRDLREVIEGYIQYWKCASDTGIPSEVVVNLFSNIEQIYHFNRNFLNELELCGTDPVLVAKCFVHNNAGFAIYTDYCTNYPRTVSVLTDLMREEGSVKVCRERQLALGHTLPLGSYLLKPVQRVLKYHLLLGNIVKHFEKERPGYPHIWNALSAMTGIAHHINDMKRKHEHAVRVQEIQSLLYGWQGKDLTTYGELAAEGTFRMFGFKGLRHVFLFDKMLLIAKKKDENILVYKAHIMCSDLMLIESIPREPLSFHVIPFDNPRRQYTLECRNLEQKREWTLQLKRVILENYSANIPAHARQLVMELGQAKPNDMSTVEPRGGGGRKAHCAPEYLEKRKDKRRASEGGFNSKLRIRRSSRSRKEKAEKENRSRSVSRTRETDEEEERKAARIASPAPSTGEKSRLKLPMWRRRSEPGVKGKLSLSISSPEKVTPPSPSVPLRKEVDEVPKSGPSFNPETLTSNRLSKSEAVTPVPVDPAECDSMYEGDDNDEIAGENLEHIVSQLLQHQLQVQQKILNKQRRGIIRKKKMGLQYETSDTENEEEGGFESRPPLPTSPPPLLSDSIPLPFCSEYIDMIFNQPEREDLGAEWSSEVASICSSNNSTHHRGSFDSNPRSASVSRSGSDIGSKIQPQIQRSNYDNLLNVWSHKKSTCLQKKISKEKNQLDGTSHLSTVGENLCLRNSIRRALSFSNEIISSDSQSLGPSSPAKTKASMVSDDCNGQSREESSDRKDRPATIAVYDQFNDNFDALEIYLNENDNCSNKNTPIPDINQNGSSIPSFSENSKFSMENLINIHPEHKIYSRASINKKSIKRVLNKLANLRGSSNKTANEQSNSLSNLYSNELDQSVIRRSSVLVSSMARQCSRTLKERIKQIRTEDLDSPTKISSPEPVYAVPAYKQSGSCIGARLALPNELDYAIPVVHSNEGSKSELRPDSVLSSSSIWTSSSSNSSNKDIKGEETKGVKSNFMDNLPEEKDESQCSVASDMSGDSFYEKSFEAIEAFLLEDEMFRDSAIYSEAEDGDTLSPGSSFRSGTLSPKSSFRKSPYVNELKPMDRKLTLVSSKSMDGAFLNAVEPCTTTIHLASSTSILDQKSSSTTPKKTPPPVPAKPEMSVRKIRSKGTLIQQQLKNLEDSQKLIKDDSLLKDLAGIKSLSERREELKSMSGRKAQDKDNLSPSTPKAIIYSDRNSSFDGKSSSKLTQSSHGFSYSPQANICNIQSDFSEVDEAVMAKGWVKHVIGKLQK